MCKAVEDVPFFILTPTTLREVINVYSIIHLPAKASPAYHNSRLLDPSQIANLHLLLEGNVRLSYHLRGYLTDHL